MYSPNFIIEFIKDKEPVTLYFDYEDHSGERVLVHYLAGIHDEGLEDTLHLYEDDAVAFWENELKSALKMEDDWKDMIASAFKMLSHQ